MNSLLRHYLRIDARSLGVFRIAFGLALIGDLFARWKYVDAFYANEGVLANHTHLHWTKRQNHSVWSAFHAFSTGGEASFAFYFVLFFYVCFTLGYKTRAFHAVSLVALVSLSARNLLTESWGNWLAIALLALTLFLPLGSRFGVDSVKATMGLANDVDDTDLNHRSKATASEIDDRHAPGWSPISIAALGVFLQLALVYVSMAMLRGGSWKQGTALHDALHTVRLASPYGFSMRDSSILPALTKFIVYAELAIPALLFVPVLRGPTRLLAALAMLVHGLIFAAFFNFGLFGWSLAAASFLVVSSETWDRWATKKNPARFLTVVYDTDCGICFWLTKLLKRLDTRGHLVFQGNDSLFTADDPESADVDVERGAYWVRDEKTGEIKNRKLPARVTKKLAEETVLAITPDGVVYERAEAVAQIFRALPFFAIKGLILSLPIISSLADFAYGLGAPRRTRISVLLGLSACGAMKKAAKHRPDPLVADIAPSTKLRHRITGFTREAFALVLVASVVVQTTHENKLPVKLGAHSNLESVAWYMRMIGRWDVLAPEPPSDRGMMVVDALTRDNKSIDTLTGKAPAITLDQPFTLGQMWSDYLYNVKNLYPIKDPQDPNKDLTDAFQAYLSKAGPLWPAVAPNEKILSVDAYWVYEGEGEETADTQPALSAPGFMQRRLVRVSRGGTALSPALPPPPPRPNMPQQPGEFVPGPIPMPPILRNPEDRRGAGDQ